MSTKVYHKKASLRICSLDCEFCKTKTSYSESMLFGHVNVVAMIRFHVDMRAVTRCDFSTDLNSQETKHVIIASAQGNRLVWQIHVNAAEFKLYSLFIQALTLFNMHRSCFIPADFTSHFWVHDYKYCTFIPEPYPFFPKYITISWVLLVTHNYSWCTFLSEFLCHHHF